MRCCVCVPLYSSHSLIFADDGVVDDDDDEAVCDGWYSWISNVLTPSSCKI